MIQEVIGSSPVKHPKIGIMAYKNKEDKSECSKRYYQNNEDNVKTRSKELRKQAILRNKLYVSSYLINHPCIDCGEDDIRVIEFDHVIGKRNSRQLG